jgi:cytochrome c oxidase subunit 3
VSTTDAHVSIQAAHPTEIGLPKDNRILGLWVFLAGECAFFASLIGTYLGLHTATLHGPTSQQIFDLPLTTVATLILLTSSLTVVLGVQAMQRKDVRGMQIWLWITALLGLFFLEFQGYEFYTFYNSGLTLHTSAFGSAFFTLTGFHGMHVLFGVFWILLLLFRSLKHGITEDSTSKVFVMSLYWHFVDVVWVVIFTLVYLAGKLG